MPNQDTIQITPRGAADILCQPAIRLNLLGWLEAYTTVKTVKTVKGEPYSCNGRQKRDDVLDENNAKIPASTVVPAGILRRFSRLSIRSMDSFKKAVDNARERAGLEADYPERPHSWAVRYNGSPLVYVHANPEKRNGKFYLQIRLNQKSCVHVKSELQDMDGNPVEFERVKCIMGLGDWPEARRQKRQAQAASQGVATEDAVFCRDFTLNNVVRFCYDNRIYEIVHVPEVEGGEIRESETAPAEVAEPATQNA